MNFAIALIIGLSIGLAAGSIVYFAMDRFEREGD